MEAKITNGNLVVTIPMNAPRPSSSGKTLVVASSSGGRETTAMVDGKPVRINLTAWIAK